MSPRNALPAPTAGNAPVIAAWHFDDAVGNVVGENFSFINGTFEGGDNESNVFSDINVQVHTSEDAIKLISLLGHDSTPDGYPGVRLLGSVLARQ